ncbi:MAG TPA: hypothetical protein VNP03_18930, partial [Pseudonocardia sp.]|nr:hypothetical protein [Pseudonocardia sp.]
GGFLPATPLPAGELGDEWPGRSVTSLAGQPLADGLGGLPIGNPFEAAPDTDYDQADPGFGSGGEHGDRGGAEPEYAGRADGYDAAELADEADEYEGDEDDFDEAEYEADEYDEAEYADEEYAEAGQSAGQAGPADREQPDDRADREQPDDWADQGQPDDRADREQPDVRADRGQPDVRAAAADAEDDEFGWPEFDEPEADGEDTAAAAAQPHPNGGPAGGGSSGEQRGDRARSRKAAAGY